MSYKSITTFDYNIVEDRTGNLLLLKVYVDLLENKLGDFVAFDLKNYFLKSYSNLDERILEIGLEIENYRYLSSKSKNSGYFDLYYYRLNRNKK